MSAEMESKKVFVGSLYEFSPEARETAIAEYGENYAAGAAKPFVNYDERIHVFSATCERTDSVAVSNIYSSVYAYVDTHEKKTQYLVHSPQLVPMKGTAIVDALDLDDGNESGEDLLGVEESSGSDFDGPAPTHDATYWSPVEGNSKMLTRDVARAITAATEADLYPEHDRNRVVIMGGETSSALQKLTNLEPLMDLLAQQSKEGGHRPSTNVLMPPDLDELSTVYFTLVSASSLATQRIVVDLRGRPFLTSKSITQLLRRSDRHEPWHLSGNLTEEIVRQTATSKAGFSNIWDNHTYSTFGDPTSAKPNPAYFMPAVPAVQKFVTAKKAHDIGKWTENVDEGVDPEAIAVEVPVEPEPELGPVHQRVMMDDTDDEEEKESEILSPLATKRLIPVDSDDDAEDNLISAAVNATNAREKSNETLPVTDKDLTSNQTRSDSPGLGNDIANGEELSSYTPHPLPPRATHQPTWASATIADRNRGRGQGQGAISEHDSTSLTRSASSPQSSSILQSLNLVGPRPPIALTRRVTGLGKSSELHFDPLRSNPTSYGIGPQEGNLARDLRSAPRVMMPAARGGGGQFFPFTGASSRDGRDAFGINAPPNYSDPDLLQLSLESSEAAPRNVRPPPGLELRITPTQRLASSATINLLDAPLENIQHPSIQPSPIHSEHSPDPLSAATRKSSNLSSANSGSSYVNTFNPPPDLARIENEQLAKLRKISEQAKEKKRLQKEAEMLKDESKLNSRTESWRHQRQEKQSADEMSSRQFHSTMKQQTPKPGSKGKQTPKKLTKKEKKEKLDNLLGSPSSLGASPKPMPPGAGDVGEMSSRKKQAPKNNPEVDPMATPHLEVKQPNSKQTLNLIQYLNPLFAASRVFPGELKFEIQLGQILIANSKNLDTGDVQDVQQFSIKNWESVFSPAAGTQQPVATTFTNVLTRNGHDIDRMLQMKDFRGATGRVTEKLFDRLNPGPSGISYEFHCQSKESQEFWVIVDSTGRYSIRKSTSMIGTVNLHFPANIWDAHAVLHGTAEFAEPEEHTANLVAAFMASVYVPAQKSLCISYRQPAEDDMTVRSVVAKRTSLHDCQNVDGRDFQLQVVEVKDLFYRFNNKDKKLAQAFEKGYTEMFEQDRIHYEVSIVHKPINEMLKQNQTLKTGDLITGTSTGKYLLKPRAISEMLDLVSHVVSKIDWVGVHNNGTLLRAMQENHDLAARVATTVVPGSRHPPASVTGMPSTASPGTATQTDVHGIRMNTTAEMGRDADGKPVFIGMGGAMIPIPDDLQIPTKELAPDDSASNVGVNPAFHSYIQSAAFARAIAAKGSPVKGPNYW